MQHNAYTSVKGVDFGNSGPSKFTARVGTTINGGVTMEIRLGSKEGRLLGAISVPITGGDNRWELVSTDVEKITGVHDLFFVFKADKPGRIMFFDYWMFSK